MYFDSDTFFYFYFLFLFLLSQHPLCDMHYSPHYLWTTHPVYITELYHNSLITFDGLPGQQVFSTWSIVPGVLSDPHIVNSLPAALPFRAGAEKEQQTAHKQPQSPAHVRLLAATHAEGCVSGGLCWFRRKQVETSPRTVPL